MRPFLTPNLIFLLLIIKDSLFLQGNDLHGTLPDHFCAQELGDPKGLQSVGMDCEKVDCSAMCCEEWKSCYYDVMAV